MGNKRQPPDPKWSDPEMVRRRVTLSTEDEHNVEQRFRALCGFEIPITYGLRGMVWILVEKRWGVLSLTGYFKLEILDRSRECASPVFLSISAVVLKGLLLRIDISPPSLSQVR